MKIIILLFVLSCFVTFNNAIQRNLTFAVNPGCPPELCVPKENKTHVNVVHVQADGIRDTVHYIWSTYKVPTILIFLTNANSTLHIDWPKLLALGRKAIWFDEEPLQTSSFVMNELYEFVDKKDVADMDKSSDLNAVGLSELIWDDVNDTLKFTESFVSAFPKASHNTYMFEDNGLLETEFSTAADVRMSDDYPHLHFSSNSSQLKFLLNNLNTNFSKSRFAAEFYAISSSPAADEWKSDDSVSINDEYSPGVFKISQLYSKCTTDAYESNCREYIVWKPVAYIGQTPTVANSTDATASRYSSFANIPPNSIAASYFEGTTHLAVTSWNMTFGSSGDGFYPKTKFTAWSVMLGLGDPVMDKMSLLAIIVISIGLGAPLLITLAGIIFLGYKKLRQKDDDLLLGG